MRWMRMRFTQRLHSELARRKPDVVMTMPHLVINVQSVLAVQGRLGFPLVMVPMLHEHDPSWPVEHMKRALTQAAAVIALTPHERARLISAYAVAPERIFVASVGVDPFEGGPAAGGPDVLFLGRKARSKGIDQLIAAMCLVWNQTPEARLVLAGASLPETHEIDEIVAALPAAYRRQIVSIGAVLDEDKARLLSSCRCLVLPSKVESFGMVLIEAWAHGTPVVTLDLPVFRDTVNPGVDGILVPSGDVPALARGILRLLEDPALARSMGARGRARARSEYSWEGSAARYLEADEHAVAQPRTTPGTGALN